MNACGMSCSSNGWVYGRVGFMAAPSVSAFILFDFASLLHGKKKRTSMDGTMVLLEHAKTSGFL